MPRRIEELEVTITREGSGRLGFGIDAMNTVVEVDPNVALRDEQGSVEVIKLLGQRLRGGEGSGCERSKRASIRCG